MTTWTDIFPELDGPPVKGVPSEFSAVASSFTKMHDDAAAILEEFSRIMGSGDFDEIKGAVAVPFRRFVDDVSDRLQSLPDVSNSAASIFANHSTKLDGFRTAADTALSQAVTKWGECKTATSQLGTAKSDADKLKQQVDNAPADADPGSTTTLKNQHDTATTHVTQLTTRLQTLETELQAYKTKGTDLHGDEKELRGETTGKLGDIDLHSLEDPGIWGSIYEGAVGFFTWAYEFTGIEALVGLIDAIAHGDWAAALWKLRDLLDKVFTILCIVALFVCPALLLVIILVVAVLKLAVGLTLYITNTPNPETGEQISLTDLAFDVVDVVTAGKAAKLREASALVRGKEAVSDGKRYFAKKSGQYTKNQMTNQRNILQKYGIPFTKTTVLRGNRKARYILETGNKTKFYIRTGQQVAGPGVKLYQGGKQGYDAANDGPNTGDITSTMEPKKRPYFTPPDPDKVIDLLTEIPVK